MPTKRDHYLNAVLLHGGEDLVGAFPFVGPILALGPRGFETQPTHAHAIASSGSRVIQFLTIEHRELTKDRRVLEVRLGLRLGHPAHRGEELPFADLIPDDRLDLPDEDAGLPIMVVRTRVRAKPIPSWLLLAALVVGLTGLVVLGLVLRRL